jgi:hypothetical protein
MARWLFPLCLMLCLVAAPLAAQSAGGDEQKTPSFDQNGVNANLAFNLNPGTPQNPNPPHPWESDRGWGGGTRIQDIVDGYRGCNQSGGWMCGLAFTGGWGNYGNEPCGVRQATINLGQIQMVSSTKITWHGEGDTPQIYKIQTWDGGQWVTQVSINDNSSYRCVRVPSHHPNDQCMVTDEFPPVNTNKVRVTFNNCPDQNRGINGQYMPHGWIWEFEAYRLPAS